MRTLIAVPCMDMVHTRFFTSYSAMPKPEGTELAVSVSSLIYNARNLLAKKAIDDGFDRVLWLDSDMGFKPDLMKRLSDHLDAGLEYISGLYFTRKEIVKPCVYKVLGLKENAEGEQVPTATSYRDYPPGQLFECAGTGFGAVMMTTDLIRKCGAQPFFPVVGFGEDFSFCLRAREAGARLYCDSSIMLDHLGVSTYNENTFLQQQREG